MQLFANTRLLRSSCSITYIRILRLIYHRLVGRSFFVGLIAVSTLVTVEKKKRGNVMQETEKKLIENTLSVLSDVFYHSSDAHMSSKAFKSMGDLIRYVKSIDFTYAYYLFATYF